MTLEQEKTRNVTATQVGYMQEFSVAFGRVSRAAFSANAEFKDNVTDLVSRAYFNLHNTSLSNADKPWANAIVASALQLCMDSRVQRLAPRELVHLFENVIRVSEEHLREAKRHAAMSSNVFYLKETALDYALNQDTAGLHAAATKVVGMHAAGRLTPKADA